MTSIVLFIFPRPGHRECKDRSLSNRLKDDSDSLQSWVHRVIESESEMRILVTDRVIKLTSSNQDREF